MAHLTANDYARNDLEVRRAIAVHVGDDATVQECDKGLKELDLLDRPAVKFLHGAKPGTVLHI